jgi:predicted RNA-binding protein with PUA-like domain
MVKSARHYWLMKSEPDVYSIEHLRKQVKGSWDGVRNYRARNYMKNEMTLGDLVLFYHSNATPPGVAGLARVCREAHPDVTQFDPKNKYFDPKSTETDPRWWLVDVEFVEEFPEFVPLPTLREQTALEGMMLLQKGMRLSVLPVEKAHFKHVLKLGKAHTRVR